MNFTIDQQEASRVLGIIKAAIPQRPSHQILGSVLVVADKEEQQVRFTASDLSLFVVVKSEASVEEGGKIAVPASLFLPIIAKQPEGEVRIQSVDDSFRISILGSGRYDIAGLDPSDYPEIPAIPSQTVELSSSCLKSGIETTEKFVSTDETKQVLTGVRISTVSGGLEFASTDGHRLAVEKVIDNNSQLDFPGITVPINGLSLVKKILLDKTVRLSYDENQISFATDEALVMVRALSGAYPAYRSLIPTKFSTKAVLQTKPFLAAVERVAILSDNLTILTLDEDGIVRISSEDKDIGNAQETLPIQLDGDPMTVAMKTKYLIEPLKTVASVEVTISLNTPESPVVISPIGVREQTFLIMPTTLIR